MYANVQEDFDDDEQMNETYKKYNPYKKFSALPIKPSGIKLDVPSKQVKQEGIQLLNIGKTEPLQKHFVTLIVGIPGSGKTFLLSQLITNKDLYYGKFDKVYILSPSKLEGIDCQLGVNYMDKLDLDWIIQKINNMKKTISDEDYTDKKNILFIIDDLVAQVKKECYNPDMVNLVFNRRHYGSGNYGEDFLCVSYIFTTQKFKVFPFQIRQTLTSIMFFNSSLAEYQAIRDEFIQSKSSKLDDMIMTAFAEDPYNFIYIKMGGGKQKIYVKFNELIL